MIRVSSSSCRRRRLASFTVVFVVTFLLLIIRICTGNVFMELGPFLSEQNSSTASKDNIHSLGHRKLLNDGKRKGDENEKESEVEPNRIWSEKCSKTDIVVSQGATETLPNGIPTYTVDIINMCVTGCNISAIHLSCGWFSSARLVNPRVFKRLRFNDCLVNNGKPLLNGRTLSFQYANTFRYPLSVSSLAC